MHEDSNRCDARGAVLAREEALELAALTLDLVDARHLVSKQHVHAQILGLRDFGGEAK